MITILGVRFGKPKKNHPFDLKPLTRYQIRGQEMSVFFMTDGNGNIIVSKMARKAFTVEGGDKL